MALTALPGAVAGDDDFVAARAGDAAGDASPYGDSAERSSLTSAPKAPEAPPATFTFVNSVRRFCDAVEAVEGARPLACRFRADAEARALVLDASIVANAAAEADRFRLAHENLRLEHEVAALRAEIKEGRGGAGPRRAGGEGAGPSRGTSFEQLKALFDSLRANRHNSPSFNQDMSAFGQTSSLDMRPRGPARVVPTRDAGGDGASWRRQPAPLACCDGGAGGRDRATTTRCCGLLADPSDAGDDGDARKVAFGWGTRGPRDSPDASYRSL